MIERKIIIGLITSTDFLRQLQPVWQVEFIESQAARHLAVWTWEYFNTYNKAPGRDIETIFFDKLKEGKLGDTVAEELEEDILPSLSEEYEQGSINVDYLLQQTLKHFKERRLEIHQQKIELLLGKGEVEQAESLASTFNPVSMGAEDDLDLSSDIALDRVEQAFTAAQEPMIRYPGALGRFWNEQLVRGSFVALMATEKRGKTFTLLDMALRARKQKRQVAFFQAGDMTEGQQLKRICVYLSQRSDKKTYCAEHWRPVADCIYNQMDKCTKEERACDFGPFSGEMEGDVRKKDLDDLVDAWDEEYEPCVYCEGYNHHKWGVPWIKQIEQTKPLSMKKAKHQIQDFFIDQGRRFKLSSHASDSLTPHQIKAKLDMWERQDGFVPDVVVVDYADLLEHPIAEFRHKQNKIWKSLRSLSQERHCLVITATQADAASYESNRLRMKNFSEDKRKYAHVTAMYGLNQDKEGREKKLKLLRINEIVIREGDFSNTNEVTVLQDLWCGRPFLGSFK